MALSAASLVFVVALFDRTAFAVDPFEIQVYDGTANVPGALGLELHANSVVSGRREAFAPELAQHHQTHLTLEPSLGILQFWELGGYLQTALRADGVFDFAGVKLRSKFVTPPLWSEHIRLGVNLELSIVPDRYDRNRWGSEIRTMAAWEDAHWLFAINPIVDTALAGPDLREGPMFQPAAMVLWKWKGIVSFGGEYYGNFGPFRGFVAWRDQEQYLYEVVNVLALRHVELNAGVGEGLTSGSNPFVIKMILGYSWERDEQKSVSFSSTGRSIGLR